MEYDERQTPISKTSPTRALEAHREAARPWKLPFSMAQFPPLLLLCHRSGREKMVAGSTHSGVGLELNRTWYVFGFLLCNTSVVIASKLLCVDRTKNSPARCQVQLIKLRLEHARTRKKVHVLLMDAHRRHTANRCSRDATRDKSPKPKATAGPQRWSGAHQPWE